MWGGREAREGAERAAFRLPGADGGNYGEEDSKMRGRLGNVQDEP